MTFLDHSFLISFVLSTSASGEDFDDGDVYDAEDVEMQAPLPPSIPTGLGALTKKKTATKPDPTAAITVGSWHGCSFFEALGQTLRPEHPLPVPPVSHGVFH